MKKRHSLLWVLILLAILTCGHALTSSAQKDVYKFVAKDGKGKEVKGCINDTLLEADLHKAFVMAWNAMLENRENFLEHWKAQLNDQNPLVAFRAKQFMKLTEKAKPMKDLDVTIVSKTLDHCDIKPLGVIDFYFLDGSHIGLVTGE